MQQSKKPPMTAIETMNILDGLPFNLAGADKLIPIRILSQKFLGSHFGSFILPEP